MFIETIVPYEPNYQLGFAITRAMQKIDNWVLILDQDVFLSLNPHWYNICLAAIEKYGYSAGWITCVTNAIGCPLQKARHEKMGSDCMAHHFQIAEDIYKANKGKTVDITEESKHWRLSGLFILTHKKAYFDVKEKFGIPDNKFIGWDNYYNLRLVVLGYKIISMQDLYVYHGYKRLWKNAEWGKGE